MNQTRLQQQELETITGTQSLDAQSLSSILVGLKFKSEATCSNANADELHLRLLKLLQSPAINTVLRAAESSAQSQGISAEQALANLVECLKEVDSLWSQILLKEGLARLSTQFH